MLKNIASNNWRASLVPAAAVIPAPIAYIKVVAVKTLVVEVFITFAFTKSIWCVRVYSVHGFDRGTVLL